ncbi:unnamed protein product [Calypogeia fissa]
MEPVTVALATCDTILNIVTNVGNIREHWFTSSDEYQSDAVSLRSRITHIQEQIPIHQPPADSSMMRSLQKAESRLSLVEARLKKLEDMSSNQRCSPVWWLYAKVSLTLFPVEIALKKVLQDLDSIPQNLKQESELSGLMQDAGKTRAMPTIVRDNDNKYVPIEKSESEVITAIEDTDGPRMILLYGGVGKGKSTLARYMCKCYGQFGEKSHLFDHVIVIACGNSSLSDLTTKQYEILKHLSPTSLTEESSLLTEVTKPGEKLDSKSRIEKALRNFFIGKKILMVLDDVSDKAFLYKMWETAKDGEDHKILITSQRSYICDDFKNDSVLIPMGDPSKEEARKILASLVGLGSKKIPGNIQEIADKMITATDRNPLALACLASNFAYTQDKGNKRYWQDAWSELSRLLDNKEMAIVAGQNDNPTPRSLWGAMKLCIDSLETKEEAKRTLFVMYACKGESVPEEVLRILCAGMNMSSCTFNRAKDELCMRELLKCTDDALASKMDLDNSPLPAWSLLSLVKLYLERYVAGVQEFSAVIGALLGDDKFSPETSSKHKEQCQTEIVLETESETGPGESDEMRINIILCALYFDRHHTDEVVSHAVTEACKRSLLVDSDNTINDLRKKSIEPLIWLLDKPEEEEQWTKADKCHVRKVVLNYICKRQLDTKNISYLLKLGACPSAQLSTLKAITHISSIEETPLLNKDTINILQVVVELLTAKEGVHARVQEAASEALNHICWKATRDKSTSLVANMAPVLDLFQHSLAIPSSKLDSLAENAAKALAGLLFGDQEEVQKFVTNKVGIVATLVSFLSLQGKPNLQYAAALALSNLACTLDSYPKLRIIQEGALPALVNCLSKDGKKKLQIVAAGVLANLVLSTYESAQMRIVSEDGVVGGLVNCLTKHDPHELQTQAAGALQNLAASRDESVQMRIVSEDAVLVGLVDCLTRHDHHELQTVAAWAFRNLAASIDESVRMRLVSEDGVLVGLVNCLTKHEHHELQTEAAGALRNLTASIDENVQMRIVSEDGILIGLVNCLTKHGHHKLQTEAAAALANLAASRDESAEMTIVSEDGVVVGRVNCLTKHDHHELQTRAAGVLRNLAPSRDESVEIKISSQDGVLVGLINCLTKHDHHELQTEAAAALVNLATSRDGSVKMRIVSEDGVLVGLVYCLTKHDHHELQTQAAEAFRNLAATRDESVRMRIVSEDGVLVGLVNCLTKHDHHQLQTEAVAALRNLAAARDESVKMRIVSEDGVLVDLVDCLTKHDHRELQVQAVGTLANLAASRDESVKMRIVSEDGVLVGLVNCLTKHDHHELQIQAAGGLASLAASRDGSVKMRIVSEDGFLVGLLNCLLKQDNNELQALAAGATGNLATFADARAILKTADGLLVGLTSLVGDNVHRKTQQSAVQALFRLDMMLAKEVGLVSAQLDVYSLSSRIFVKAKLGDLEGALDDANQVEKLSRTMTVQFRAFALQERGVLKRMMGDLDGALADLDEGLEPDLNDYEMLKHRGYVKFLLNDMDAARADAEWALSLQSSIVHDDCLLGTIPVEYLGYKL